MKTYFYCRALIFLFLLNYCSSLFAATYNWKPTSGHSAKVPGNWRLIACGGGGASATTLPGTNDTLLFSSCSVSDCTLDTTFNVKMIDIRSNYTGIISTSTGSILTFEEGKLKGGTFNGGSIAINFTLELEINGTVFTSTSGVLTIIGDFIYKGSSFSHNNGTIIFKRAANTTTIINGTSNASTTLTLYKAEFAASTLNTTFSIRNMTMVVENELKMTGTYQLFLNTTTSSTVECRGNVITTNTNGTGGGSILLLINGTGSQSLAGNQGMEDAGKLPSITINKSGGTLSLSGILVMGGSTTWTYTAGTVSEGTAKVICTYNGAINNNSGGTMQFYILGFYGRGDNHTITGKVKVTDSLIASLSGVCIINGDTIEAQGNIIWNNTSSGSSINTLVKFVGYKTQYVSGNTVVPFSNVVLDKTGGSIILKKSANISDNIDFTRGFLISDTTNLLIVKSGATASNASDKSFVRGTVKKIGSSSFVFPIGKADKYRPLSITAPSNSTDAFQSEYFDFHQTLGNDKDTLSYLSSCEYWHLKRATGTSSVKVTLYFDSVTCDVYTLSTLRIARWDGGEWVSVGGVNTTGTIASGTIQSSTYLNDFGYFLIAKKSPILYADAGANQTICAGIASAIGGSPSASGGLTPYSYEWFPQSGLDDPYDSNPNASPIATKSYILKITDLDYTVAYDTVIYFVRFNPTVDAGGNRTIDPGGSTIIGGAPTAQRPAPSSPYIYSWSPSTSLSATNTANPTASPSSTITYTVTVTDTAGCEASDQVSIVVAPVALDSAAFFSILASDTIKVTYSSSVTGRAGASQFISTSVTATDGNTHNVSTPLRNLDTAIARINRLTATTISNDLSDITLGEGIYKINGTAILDGVLTLEGDGESFFVINISDSLRVSPNSAIDFNGVLPSQVYIKVESHLIATGTVYLSGVFLVGGKIRINDSKSQSIYLGKQDIQADFLQNSSSITKFPLKPISPILIDATERSIGSDWLGFNGNNTVDVASSNWGSPNPNIRNKIETLHAGTIRFIAGSQANYWQWEKGDFYTEDEIPDYCAIYDNAPFCGYGVPNTFIAKSPNPLDKIEDFKIGLDKGRASPIFVLNMLTDSLAPQINLLYNATCKGLQVKYAELGNEFYLSDNPHFNLVFPTECDYAAEANRWAATIKDAFPDIKIAAIGATRKETNPRSVKWNDNIFYSADCGSEPGFSSDIDAVTFHVYDGPPNLDVTPTLPDVFYQAYYGIDVLNDLPPSGSGEFTIFDNASFDFEGWITEYGYNDKDESEYGGTWVQGLYTAAMTLKFLETKDISHVNAQTLIGEAKGGAIFEEDPDYDGDFQFTCIGNALKPLCDAIRFHTQATAIDFQLAQTPSNYLGDNFGVNFDYPVLNGWFFEGDLSDEIVVINLSDNTYTFDFSGILSAPAYVIQETYSPATPNDPAIEVEGDADYAGTKGVIYKVSWFENLVSGPMDITLIPWSIVRLRKSGSKIGEIIQTAQNTCGSQKVTVSAYAPTLLDYALVKFESSQGIDYMEYADAYKEYLPDADPFTVDVTLLLGDPLYFTEIDLGTATINLSTPSSVTIGYTPTTLCPGANSYVTLTATTGLDNYNWSPSVGLFSDAALLNPTEVGNPVYASPPNTTSYYLNVLDATNQCYCTNIGSAKVTVSPVADAGPDIFMCDDILGHENVYIGPLTALGLGDSYSWTVDPSGGLTFDAGIEKAKITGATPGNYIATLEMVDGSCTTTDDVNVTVVDCCTGDGDDIIFDPFSTDITLQGSYWTTSEIAEKITSISQYTVDVPTTSDPYYVITKNSGSKDIVINGILYVDESLHIKKSTLKMGNAARISIDNDLELALLSDNLSACNDSWKGIYAEGELTRVIIEPINSSQTSTISGASNAFFSRYDADFDIRSTTFSNNYNHLRLMESKNGLGSDEVRIVEDCIFTSSANFCDTAIAVEHFGDLPFGNASSPQSYLNGGMNTVDGANQFGILAYKSQLEVFNSTFENITSSSDDAVAVSVYQDQPETYPFNDKFFMGGTGTDEPNSIESSDNGIIVHGMESTIIGNSIGDGSAGVNLGISISSTNGLKTKVNYNTIYTNPIAGSIYPVGIYVDDFDGLGNPTEGTIIIGDYDGGTDFGNTIYSNGETGISLNGSSGAILDHNKILMDDATSTNDMWGIYINGGSDNVIQYNKINDPEYLSYLDCNPTSECHINNKIAITNLDAIGTQLICNRTNATEIGLQFLKSDDDDIPLNAIIRGNTIQWHNDGLAIGGNGVLNTAIGPQDLYQGDTPGNYWKGDGLTNHAFGIAALHTYGTDNKDPGSSQLYTFKINENTYLSGWYYPNSNITTVISTIGTPVNIATVVTGHFECQFGEDQGRYNMETNQIEMQSCCVLFPNPSTGNLILQYLSNNSSMRQISLVDLAGIELLHYIANADELETIIDASGLNEGIYFLLVQAGSEEISVNKVVIAK